MNQHIKSFQTKVSRRQVMIGAAGLSFAIALGDRADAAVLASERTGTAMSPWVSIAPDGTITIMSAVDRDGAGIDDLAAANHRGRTRRRLHPGAHRAGSISRARRSTRSRPPRSRS